MQQNAPFSFNGKVYINHTDAGGIVYHANYLIFCENCRREWFCHLDIPSYFLQNDNQIAVHFVVSEVNIKYITPLLLDDLFVVTIDKVLVKSASLIVEQSVFKKQGDELLLSAKASFIIPCVQNHNGQIKPAKLPSFIKEKLQGKI